MPPVQLHVIALSKLKFLQVVVKQYEAKLELFVSKSNLELCVNVKHGCKMVDLPHLEPFPARLELLLSCSALPVA